MSKILLQIAKNSLMPAATMIVSKLLGLYVATVIFNTGLLLDNQNEQLFSVQIYITNRTQTMVVNSFANLIMLMIMLSSTMYVWVRFSLFQSSKQNPRTIAKLTKFNIVKWVTDKGTGFLQLFTWGIYLIATCAVVLSNTYSGQNHLWLGGLSFVVAILTIWIIIRSYEKAINQVYPL